MAEMRDPYTAGHQHTVDKLALAIGVELGLPLRQLEGLQLAASVHDTGKIMVPAEILCKPTKLAKHEFDLIKDHAQAGYDILKDVDFPWPIARIMAVADVVEACLRLFDENDTSVAVDA